jgi:hypothetical protein
MARVGEDLPDRALLDQLAAVHDADPVTHARDGAEVVADEQDRRAMPAAQLADQIEHGGLHGDVETGRRLVHDQQRGLRDQRHRDHDPLLLTAGELVRIAVHHRLGIGQPHFTQHRERARARRRRIGALVDHRDFHQLPADGHHRVEARHRILVDHRDAPSADRAQRRIVQRREVAPLEHDPPARDPPGAAEIAHDRERHRRLAAPRLAHEAERLAGAQ